jgi:hypothetical protein
VGSGSLQGVAGCDVCAGSGAAARRHTGVSALSPADSATSEIRTPHHPSGMVCTDQFPSKCAAESRSPNSHYEYYYHTANQIRKLMEDPRAAFLRVGFFPASLVCISMVFLPLTTCFYSCFSGHTIHNSCLRYSTTLEFAIQVPNSTKTPSVRLPLTALATRLSGLSSPPFLLTSGLYTVIFCYGLHKLPPSTFSSVLKIWRTSHYHQTNTTNT